MGEKTAISWCDHTFNPWIGCTKVSVGAQGACVGCYAEVSTPSRALGVRWGDHPRHRTSASYWRQPLAWDRKAAIAGTRPFVFCASLADVFDNQVDPAWREALFALIRATPDLVWLLLTKRPQNIVRLSAEAMPVSLAELRAGPLDGFPKNAAIGCTVVTQAEADRDIPVLLAAKAVLKPAFAFVSMEPLMGAVDLTRLYLGERPATNIDRMRIMFNALTGAPKAGIPGLDWVITGGESDQGAQKARAPSARWFRELRDQCSAASVPFHFKQWGEWTPGILSGAGPWAFGDYEHDSTFWPSVMHVYDHKPRQFDMFGARAALTKVGKKAAGRALDGVIHDARPVGSGEP